MDRYFWAAFGMYALPVLAPGLLALGVIFIPGFQYVMFALIGAMFLALFFFMGKLVLEEAAKMRKAGSVRRD